MADTLQLHVDPIGAPSHGPGQGPAGLAMPPRLQLRDPSASFGAPPQGAHPAMPQGMPAAPATPDNPEAPSPQLTRDGIEMEAEATRPAAGGPIQLFPSARMTARTPYLGGAVGPDVRGPVTSAEVGATIAQVGNEDLNAQLRAAIELGPTV